MNINDFELQMYLRSCGRQKYKRDAKANDRLAWTVQRYCSFIYRHRSQPVTNYNYAPCESLQHWLRPICIKRSFYLYVGLKRRSSMKRTFVHLLETTSAEAASSCETFGAPKHDPNSSPFRGARSFFVTSLTREKKPLQLREAEGPKNTFPELVAEKRSDFRARTRPTLQSYCLIFAVHCAAGTSYCAPGVTIPPLRLLTCSTI
jgi:hypothetical protein